MIPLIVCGVELELEYNPDLIGHVESDTYHGNKPCNFSPRFYAEQDSSLSCGKFRNGRTAELISKPFEIKSYKKVLREFQKEIYRRISTRKGITEDEARKRYGLKDVISFNHTTGAHLHFSVLKPSDSELTICFKRCNPRFKGQFIPVKELISPAFCERFNTQLLKEVCEKYPDVFPEFEAQYYRGHARSLKKNPEAIRTHYGNWSTDSRKPDVEIRGFNLNGVTNWKQFKGVYNVFLHLLYKTIRRELKRGKAFPASETIQPTTTPQHPTLNLIYQENYTPYIKVMREVTINSRNSLDSPTIGITEKRIYEITINPAASKAGGLCLYCGKALLAGELYFCKESGDECEINGKMAGRERCAICGISKNPDIAYCSIICWRDHVNRVRTPEQIAEHRRNLEHAREHYRIARQHYRILESNPETGESQEENQDV